MLPSLGRGRGKVAVSTNTTVSHFSLNSNHQSQSYKHGDVREKMLHMAAHIPNDSSSDEEIYDEEIIFKTMKQYQAATKDSEMFDDNHYLLDVLQAGASTCLICLDNLKRQDAVWNCVNCACIFHLMCIQKWAKEGVGRHALIEEGLINTDDLSWHCPKCRHEYKNHECPTKYLCFCGKEVDPVFDPWISPHSCGQQCLKSLRPDCGHECLLLCHPGNCPPCPKTVSVLCHCGDSQPRLQRCSNRAWSCGKPCNAVLPCGYHRCQELCHSGVCPPCNDSNNYTCLCGKEKKLKLCIEREWQCEQMCGEELECGYHLCEKLCHAKPCEQCPRSGVRACPCGKTFFSLHCTDDVEPCEDTCLKELSCAAHLCAKRCHYGPCEICIQVVHKTCRCGRKEKEIPCSQQLICEFKCTKLKSCGRHACKRKCCTGDCPPCEQICNRKLNCGNHKCPSPCHLGMCYPCPSTKKVSCFCGSTFITVPCGKEKSTKPPKCKKNCSIAPRCHHVQVKPHHCHFGRCPPCEEKCSKSLPCSHLCQMRCHDQVFDRNATEQNVMMRNQNKKSETDVFVDLPCPECRFPVTKRCCGGHVTKSFSCCELNEYSCGRECGRELACGNHVCQRECHRIKSDPGEGKAGRNCIPCEESCLKARPDGCIHDCKLPCHPGECPDCTVDLKLECHCRTMKMYLHCCLFNKSSQEARNELLCCKSRCPKTISCGHLCSKICHSDLCSKAENCVEKVAIRCSCGRRKKPFPCADAVSGKAKLVCDERCVEEIEKKKRIQEENEMREKEVLDRKQQEELKWFERKKQSRSKRKAKQIVDANDERPTRRYMYFIPAVLAAFVAVVVLKNI